MTRFAPLARGRRAFGSILATAVIGVMTILPLESAVAATAVGGVNAVHFDQPLYSNGTTLKLDFEWAVADGSQAGDTFSLTVPPAFDLATSNAFDLLAPDGTTVVAHAVWSGSTVTFTLSDYVESHQNVHGDGYLSLKFAQTASPGDVVTGDFATATVSLPATVQVTPSTGTGVITSTSKSGYWNHADQGLNETASALGWFIQIPTGPIVDYVLVDSIGAGSTIDCARGNNGLTVRSTVTLDTSSRPIDFAVVDAARYQVTCTADSFTLTIPTIATGEFWTVNYSSSVVDQSRLTFRNSVAATWDGHTQNLTADNERDTAGGTGTGNGLPTEVTPSTVSTEVTPSTEPTQVTPPTDTPPVERPTAETPPVDTPPVDTPPVDTPPVSTPPVSTPPVIVPPIRTRPTNTSRPSSTTSTHTTSTANTPTSGASRTTASHSKPEDTFHLFGGPVVVVPPTLASTGVPVTGLLWSVLGLVIAGAGALLVGRRRSVAGAHRP